MERPRQCKPQLSHATTVSYRHQARHADSRRCTFQANAATFLKRILRPCIARRGLSSEICIREVSGDHNIGSSAVQNASRSSHCVKQERTFTTAYVSRISVSSHCLHDEPATQISADIKKTHGITHTIPPTNQQKPQQAHTSNVAHVCHASVITYAPAAANETDLAVRKRAAQDFASSNGSNLSSSVRAPITQHLKCILTVSSKFIPSLRR